MQQVSVIVPSFNRAHLLPQTLVTYLQPEVAELILVDDGSNDDTEPVVTNMKKQDSRIVYVKQPVNQGQAAAKNVGIRMATSPYLFFGDDDSVLLAGTIKNLLGRIQAGGYDVIGVKALYMLPGETIQSTVDRHRGKPGRLLSINSLSANFTLDVEAPVQVPFAPACFMTGAAIARSILFDPVYRGSGYREETDFLLRCSEAGYIVAYCSEGAQINLPRTQASGGAWGHGRFCYEWSAVCNNWLFLRRHYTYLHKRWNLQTNIGMLQLRFIGGRVLDLSKRCIKRLLGLRY